MAQIAQNNTVIAGKTARFSLLSETLVRMEYSPNGCFEDRSSFRAVARPEPVAFLSVEENNGWYSMRSKKLRIRYKAGENCFSSDNLEAADAQSGEVFWHYGQADNQNLGAAHTSMDYVSSYLIPSGVHPATSQHHMNTGKQNFWRLDIQKNPIAAKWRGDSRHLRIDEFLASVPCSEYTDDMKKIVHERRHHPPGLLSRAGYFVFDDSEGPVLSDPDNWVKRRNAPQGQLDLYLFFYGCDFKQAYRDFVQLFGPAQLPPRYSFGMWFSRFPTYTIDEIREALRVCKENGLPLDVVVLDLEWHKRGWHGYDWNADYMGCSADKYFRFLKENDLHTTLSEHPNDIPVEDSRFREFLEKAALTLDESQTRVQKRNIAEESRVEETKLYNGHEITSKKQADAFFDVLHGEMMGKGLDFWWQDGEVEDNYFKNMQSQDIDNSHVDSQLWTNHVYCRFTEEKYPDRRPLAFSRMSGFGSHRYPFHFTGDTWPEWGVLKGQVEYTVRAGHMGASFITHDIGGFKLLFRHVDQNLFCRWIQFGALSPIFRLHSGGGGERRPWMYEPKVMKCAKQALQLRNTLAPYLYTLAWETSQTGLPLCRSLCIEYPDWEKGYEQWTTYMLGDRIFVAPIVEELPFRKAVLPPGLWYYANDQRCYESTGEEEITVLCSATDLPVHYYKAGSIMVKQEFYERTSAIPEKLIIEIYCFGEPCTDTFDLYEDDGFSRKHEKGACRVTRFFMKEGRDSIEIGISPVEGSFIPCANSRKYEIRLIGRDMRDAQANTAIKKKCDQGIIEIKAGSDKNISVNIT